MPGAFDSGFDSGFDISGGAAIAVGAALESESAQGVSAVLVDQFIAVPWVSEAEVAQAVSAVLLDQSVAIGSASETEAAQSVSAVVPSLAGTGWGIPIGIT